MIPAPTKTGFWPWRRVRKCYCMVFDFQNPHGWVRAYCPPEPMAPHRNHPDWRPEWRP